MRTSTSDDPRQLHTTHFAWSFISHDRKSLGPAWQARSGGWIAALTGWPGPIELQVYWHEPCGARPNGHPMQSGPDWDPRLVANALELLGRNVKLFGPNRSTGGFVSGDASTFMSDNRTCVFCWMTLPDEGQREAFKARSAALFDPQRG